MKGRDLNDKWAEEPKRKENGWLNGQEGGPKGPTSQKGEWMATWMIKGPKALLNGNGRAEEQSGRSP